VAYDRNDQVHVAVDEGFEVVPFTDANLFEGVREVISDHNGDGWMAWLQTALTGSNDFHYFAMFTHYTEYTALVYKFPRETGFDMTMVEQKNTYENRWYILTSNNIDKVYIYKIMNMFDKDAIMF